MSFIEFLRGGWGLAMLIAAAMTIAVALAGYTLGMLVGVAGAVGEDRRRTHHPRGRRRLHHGPARHSRPPGDLSFLLRQQRDPDAARAILRRNGLHQPAGIPGRRAGNRDRLGRVSDRGVPRRIPGDSKRRARSRDCRRHDAVSEIPPHRRSARAALCGSGHGQRVAARVEGDRAHFRDGARRDSSPGANRRRLDTPAFPVLLRALRCST